MIILVLACALFVGSIFYGAIYFDRFKTAGRLFMVMIVLSSVILVAVSIYRISKEYKSQCEDQQMVFIGELNWSLLCADIDGRVFIVMKK